MTSGTTASFLNTSREDSPSMSHSSKAASIGGSDFGKLTLGASSGSSRSDEMKTRSMTRKAAAKVVPASSSGQRRGNAPVAGPSRRGVKGSTGRTSAGRKDEDDEDDDDENDSDDSDESSSEDDDDRPTQPRVSSPPQISTRDRLRLIMSAYDPSQRSPIEFTYQSDRDLPEASRTYRAQIDDFSRLITSPEALEPFVRRLHISSPMWGSLIVRALENRMRTTMASYLANSPQTPRQDAIDTISEFNKLFVSIESLLLQPVFRTMDSNARNNLALLTMQILEFIVAQNTDARGSVGVPYAGGTRHHEYNLYMRFARSEWNVTMAKLNTMVTPPDVRAMFMRPNTWACLMRAYQTVVQRHPPPVPGDVGDFYASLRTLVGRLSNREA
ncbi:unnamed protein product [Zymoseptoria tritici ST99CH_1A5]|uniref:Uncharacterized protein n=3 Tax=Zymoseptoria tritici TaxID=1047171 RepID=A0A1X7RZ77_ZYMT9|nr:unnamed protein product [Zymoseptoria tritici ST99CH_3D7]SMR55325.1 unnamed protein product [Zymoseptoria tritici ST99CH_1E4]SMY26137.1 unnamed protein product [Zymoseptoria tritici ST99CH_1A5]